MDFIISKTPQVLNFFLPFLIGSLLFFSTIIAPTVFKYLDEKNSRTFIRAIFPKLYTWAFIICLILSALSFFYNILFSTILLVIASIYLFSKKYLVKWLNTISDMPKKTKQQQKKFVLLHTLSVMIFICQILVLLILYYFI